MGSVVSRDSFEKVQSLWIPEITHYCPNTPYLIVGLKNDLRDDQQISLDKLEKLNQTLPISNEEGFELAKDFNRKYFECSSLHDRGIIQLFEEVINTVMSKSKNQQSPLTYSFNK
eukprot:TRINITY_DN3295_c1_g1_i1.p1 TRINITY_DN3295_c1_g1~~TRINITY_DN3295_c1_g1_i1.p1  ORF type:complete len:115 (-),score=40.65 TRINITY_DN3295_c1_g1_i1:8-352(-)